MVILDSTAAKPQVAKWTLTHEHQSFDPYFITSAMISALSPDSPQTSSFSRNGARGQSPIASITADSHGGARASSSAERTPRETRKGNAPKYAHLKMEEAQMNNVKGVKDGDTPITASTSQDAEPIPAAEKQVAAQSKEVISDALPPEVPVVRASTLADVHAPLESPAPNLAATYSTSVDRSSMPAVANGLTANKSEGLIPFPDLTADPALFSEDDPWAQNFDPSQIDDNESVAASEVNQIQAFARLDFDDGEFYMTTYAVELGRDVRAAREALQQEEAQPQDPNIRRSRKRSRSGGRSGRSRKRHKEHKNYEGSVVSETGGIIGMDPPEEDDEEAARLRWGNAKSTSSSSQYLSRKSSFYTPKKDYNRLTQELEDWMVQQAGADLLDAPSTDNREQMPSADKIPLIPIHPPANANGMAEGHQSISRKHVKIFFNFESHMFQVVFWGRNGGFVDEQWYATGETVTLVSGSTIQLKGVQIRFTLPDVPVGETGAEGLELGEGTNPLNGGAMNFDMADSDELEENDYEHEFEEDTGVVDFEDEEEEPEEELTRTRGKLKTKKEPEPEPEPEAQKPKRKGPGRPPKNGVMSKREQAQQAREARENAKAKAEGRANPAQGRGKGKTAKQLELEENNLQPNGKRKYTKRKKIGELEDAQKVRESTEQDDSVPPEAATKPAKDKKPIKPPRSPSPVFNEAELTPEQLAKPQSSYVVLIHEALSNSKTGQMSLPQIYRAIERRYPFFKLRVQTQGWQSSVRHNLSQHAAFRKIERDGKGWMWGLVPEVSIEKEKKRRPTPPPATQQNYQYPPNPPRYSQHTHPYPPYPPVSAPGNAPMPFPYQVPPLPFPPRLGPNGFPMPFAQPQAESTYKSPYDTNPDPAPTPSASTTTPQAAPKEKSGNGYYSIPTSRSPTHQHHQQTSTGDTTAPTAAPTHSPIQNDTQLQPATSTSAPKYSADMLARVDMFKTCFIDSMGNSLDSSKLVTSVIDRKLSGAPVNENANADEKAVLKALENLLDGPEGKPSRVGEVKGETVAEKAADIARRIQDETSTGG